MCEITTKCKGMVSMKFRVTGVSEGGEGRNREEDDHTEVPTVLVLCLRLDGEFMWGPFIYI